MAEDTPPRGSEVNGRDAGLTRDQRLRLEALRYAVNEESASYLAIMSTFTSAISGLLSDQSAAEVAERLAGQGLVLETDVVDARLSYLVEHGNLARSPRETEARSLRDYLTNRARYQLTQRGELVQRQVEELLDHAETAHEISTELLPGILEGLQRLAADHRAEGAEPDLLAREIVTVFAQFERLVESTREFYTYLSQVLVRYDLERAEFQAFKTALLDYLQRFVDEIGRHLPQISDTLDLLDPPRVRALVDAANSGQRLRAVDGGVARRAPGLDVADWDGLRSWFVGAPGRDSDAAGVRRLATDAMRALLVNLRRIAASNEREHSRYADLLRLARWFDDADDEVAHALWAAAFGLYSCRHLSFGADDDSDPVPATASWWRAAVAEVPVTLRTAGERRVAGRSGRRADFTAAKQARVDERARSERRRLAALGEVAAQGGERPELRLSDEARVALLEVYNKALTARSRVLRPREEASAEATVSAGSRPEFTLSVRHTPGRGTTIISPAGRLELVDMTLGVTSGSAAGHHDRTMVDAAQDLRGREATG